MPTRSESSPTLKAAISVSEMCRLVQLSRARFYELVTKEIFVPPVYCLVTRRPFYTSELQRRNLLVREKHIGMNGQYVPFYRRHEPSSPQREQQRSTSNAPDPLVSALVRKLKALGHQRVNADAVTQAVTSCFPEGTADREEHEVLRAVNRHLRRSGSA